MSIEAIDQFRAQVAADPELQARFGQAYETGPAALTALGRERGWQFTEAEAAETIERCLDDGELTDYELELVAGGSNPSCQESGSAGRSPEGTQT